jgi:hypothetical protein
MQGPAPQVHLSLQVSDAATPTAKRRSVVDEFMLLMLMLEL